MAAVSSPLLDSPVQRAKGVVFTITGNSGMSLVEVNEVAEVISSICADDANIIFGTSVDESYGDEISVTVVATSFEKGDQSPILDAGRSNVGNQYVGIPPHEVAEEHSPAWRAAAAPPAEPVDPYAPPAPQTRKPRFWGRF